MNGHHEMTEFTRTVPVAVIIPTFNRGTRVIETLEKVLACDPGPSEIWVHVDKSDGDLERVLAHRFPFLRILSSQARLGPGGGRHRCLEQCALPYGASFDDDSYPVDGDFFDKVLSAFTKHPKSAIIEAQIWQRGEEEKKRSSYLKRKMDFIGCGCAIRLEAYRQTRGYIARPVAYGMEETDLSIQLFARNWQIYQSGELRVFHDTNLSHHDRPEFTAGTIANVALFAFLHYPLPLWAWGMLQVANRVGFHVKRRQVKGVLAGLLSVPLDCYAHRRYRSALPRRLVWQFLSLRRTIRP